MHCWICGDKVSQKKAHYTKATVRNSRDGHAESTRRPVCPKCAKHIKADQ